MSMTEKFDAEVTDITQRRGSVYGDPSEHLAAVAQIKAAVAECDDPQIRHVLEMIAVKMARAATSPHHLDNWVDIAGYARVACMVLDAREVEAQRSL